MLVSAPVTWGSSKMRRNDAGVYAPDPMQIGAVRDSIGFFDAYLK